MYTNSNASGTALIGGDLFNASVPLTPFSVAVRGSPAAANALVAALEARANVSAVAFWGDSEDAPLRWSEVVPLTFLAGLTNASAESPGVLVWTQPLRRYNCSACMIPELLALGGQLFDLLDDLPERVIVVVSADLAHTHPAAVNPYPPNAAAADGFDRAVGLWAATLDGEALLGEAGRLADTALSCGYTGLVLLHGMLSRLPLSSWKPVVHAHPSAPTYYGMMVSSAFLQ